MSNDKDKFKLIEDPEVSGGVGRRRSNYDKQFETNEDNRVEVDIAYNFCTKCGNQLIRRKCPYCEIEYPVTGKLEQLDDDEVPRTRSKKNSRSNW